jgi:hypothetical protein
MKGRMTFARSQLRDAMASNIVVLCTRTSFWEGTTWANALVL